MIAECTEYRILTKFKGRIKADFWQTAVPYSLVSPRLVCESRRRPRFP